MADRCRINTYGKIPAIPDRNYFFDGDIICVSYFSGGIRKMYKFSQALDSFTFIGTCTGTDIDIALSGRPAYSRNGSTIWLGRNTYHGYEEYSMTTAAKTGSRQNFSYNTNDIEQLKAYKNYLYFPSNNPSNDVQRQPLPTPGTQNRTTLGDGSYAALMYLQQDNLMAVAKENPTLELQLYNLESTASEGLSIDLGAALQASIQDNGNVRSTTRQACNADGIWIAYAPSAYNYTAEGLVTMELPQGAGTPKFKAFKSIGTLISEAGGESLRFLHKSILCDGKYFYIFNGFHSASSPAFVLKYDANLNLVAKLSTSIDGLYIGSYNPHSLGLFL